MYRGVRLHAHCRARLYAYRLPKWSILIAVLCWVYVCVGVCASTENIDRSTYRSPLQRGHELWICRQLCWRLIHRCGREYRYGNPWSLRVYAYVNTPTGGEYRLMKRWLSDCVQSIIYTQCHVDPYMRLYFLLSLPAELSPNILQIYATHMGHGPLWGFAKWKTKVQIYHFEGNSEHVIVRFPWIYLSRPNNDRRTILKIYKNSPIF